MKKTILTLLSAVLLVSCQAVQIDPNTKYDVSYGFKNATNAKLYLNNFYEMIYDFGQFGSSALGGTNTSMSDGLTDILKYGSIVAGTGDCNLIMTVSGRQSVSSNYFDSWTTCYQWIRRLNEFLSGLDENKGNFSSAEYEQFRAEALFFRAYAYHLILRSHASVKDDLGAILYTDISTMNSDNKRQPRANLEDSWNLVRDDILYAAEHLPEPADAVGRLNRYVALALEARSMLYAACCFDAEINPSYPITLSEGRTSDYYYGLAKAAAGEIIDSGLYGYIDDYSEIFTSTSNSEVIWGFDFYKGSLVHNFDYHYSQPGDICDSGSYGGGYAGPTQEFVDSYDYADGTPFDTADTDNRWITNDNVGNRDPRLAASVLYNGAIWKGRALECYEGGVDQKYMPYGDVNSPGNTVSGYYMRKLLDESNTDYVLDGSYQPWIEFRYAEMTLIYAECLAREGNYADCRATVHALRQKRFASDDVFTADATDYTSAMDLILKERLIELCYEGHRFWDLRRTGRAVSVLDGKTYTGVYWHLQSDGSFTPESVSCDMGAHLYPDYFDRFPIPQTEISNNVAAKQNSDW